MSEPAPFLIETPGLTLRLLPDRVDPALMTSSDRALINLLLGLADDSTRWAAFPPVGPAAFDAQGRFPCPQCSRVFDTPKALGGHTSSHRPVVCPHEGCGRRLRPSSYANHVNSCEMNPDPPALAYPCGAPGCDAAFPSATARGGHRTSTHPGMFPGRSTPRVKVRKSDGPSPTPAGVESRGPDLRALASAAPALSAEERADMARRSAARSAATDALASCGIRAARLGAQSWTILDAVAGAGSDEQAAAYAQQLTSSAERRLRLELDLEDGDGTVGVLGQFRVAVLAGRSAVA